MSAEMELEFERRLAIEELAPGDRQSMTLEASEAERAAVAERLKVLSIGALQAELDILRDLTGDVIVTGRILADVEQACVVTLEPVGQRVDAELFQRYSARSAEPEGEEEDPIEPIHEGEIEVGDVIVQNLSLALDPYPRAPESHFEAVDDDAGKPSGPFAALAALQEKGEK